MARDRKTIKMQIRVYDRTKAYHHKYTSKAKSYRYEGNDAAQWEAIRITASLALIRIVLNG